MANTPPIQGATPIVDANTTANTLKINNDGSINVASESATSVSGTLQSAAAATGAGTALAVLGNGSIEFTVTGTFVGTITWQGSEDGTNFSSIYAVQLGTSTISTTATAPGTFEASISGLQKVQANITAYTSGTITVTAHAVPGSFSPRSTNAIIQAVGGTALAADQTNSELRVSTYVKTTAAGDTALTVGQATMANSLPVTMASNQGPIGSLKATYSYSISALGTQTAHTDMMVLRGSASKTVKIIHFECSGAATAATGIVWFLKKHTIANTGGTGTLAATATQHDSADGAATAVINTYQTTLPTIDASATLIRSVRLDLAVAPAAQAYATDRYIEDFGINGGEPIVLRGVAQEFALNLGGGTIPTGEVVDFSITWTEE